MARQILLLMWITKSITLAIAKCSSALLFLVLAVRVCYGVGYPHE